MMAAQVQTCPRRMGECGPWQYTENIDFWTTDRWPKPPRLTTVRTCSFCGSAHPEDVLALLEEGWEHERTDKPYKGYLNPPGQYAAWAALTAHIQDGKLGNRELPRTIRPELDMTGQPPIKFYIPHFSSEQLATLNDMLAAGKGTPKL